MRSARTRPPWRPRRLEVALLVFGVAPGVGCTGALAGATLAVVIG